jgi:hypothetical protein
VPALAGWENFFVIVGSSAGALIGLQFVVMALVANMPRTPRQVQVGDAFATPTIIHFATVLLLSAALSAPWHGIGGVALLIGLLGLSGVVYTVIVIRRMRVQTAYHLAFEHWLFRGLLPLAPYTMLAASAYAACVNTHEAMFSVAAAALLLLFIGIHNAWNATTYHVFVKKQEVE